MFVFIDLIESLESRAKSPLIANALVLYENDIVVPFIHVISGVAGV